MDNSALMKRYEAAVQSFVDKVRSDPNVIAVIVYGSVSHGTVWEHSDIDMTVIVRDQKLENKGYGIYEDDILINIDLVQRSDLRRYMDKEIAGSVNHSFSATSKIVYTTDDSLYAYMEENKQIGKRDMERSLFLTTGWVMGSMLKIRKWIEVKHDLDYARFYIFNAANAIAVMEVTSRYEVPTREAILQAAKLNPPLMDKFFYQPMSAPMTAEAIYALMAEMDQYLMGHMEAIQRAADECFGDGEIKTGTQVSRFYKTSLHALDTTLDYLCEKGYLIRVSQVIRLTPKSKPAVDEMAYIKSIEN